MGTGATSIDIEPAPAAIASGATLSISCCELDSVVKGSLDGAYIAVQVANVDGVSVPATIRRSAKNDIFHSGGTNRRLLYNGVYDQCGQLNDASLLVNISLGAAGTINRDVSVVGACFEPSGAPKVSANVYGRAANNQTSGLLVTDCDLRSTGYPINYLYPTDATFEDLGPPQVYGNRNHNGPTAYEFDPAQGAAMRAGPVWYYFRNGAPSNTSNRPIGSKWINLQAAAGSTKGSIWTSSGWISEENLLLQNSATYDPPSLAAGALDTTQTMTVTGAALGDIVDVSFSVALGGARLEAWVSAANTVSYRFSNPTGSPIDLGSGTVKARIRK